MIAGMILAAGAGTRFGEAKQLAELDGRPLLEHATIALAASGLDRFVVVVGNQAEEVLAAVDLHGGEPVICERWEQGQAASMATGLAAVAEAEAVVVTLGDQPGLAPEAVYRVLDQRGTLPAVRATYGGEPGHPVVIESELFPDLRDVTGDAGVRAVIGRAGVHEVPCDDLGGGEDVDTPADLIALRMEGPR